MKVMQKWQLEVCRMFIYMTFPVAMFHYFNSPQIFEDAVKKIKIENSTPMTKEQMEHIEDLIQKVNIERENKLLKELAANNNRA